MSPKLLNVLLVILPVVIYLGYIDPAYSGLPGPVWTPEKSINSLQLENVRYIDTLAQVDLIDVGIKKVQADYESISTSTKQKIEIMLPDSIDKIKLRNEILRIASNSGIAIDGLTVEKGNGFYTVSFGMKARYPVFKKSIEVFERNMRFFILEKASLSKANIVRDEDVKNVVEDGLLNISLTFRTYYFK